MLKYGDMNNSQQGPYPELFTSADFVFPPSELNEFANRI
jgi:hypothetical protein